MYGENKMTDEVKTKVPVDTNPLLMAGRIPGETFQLPSGGLFYNDGELASSVIQGELHVFPMTALDEIVIKTPDMLFSGEAIKQIFARCIPDVIKPLRLLAKDVDFLLICLRSISFGDNVTVIHKHTCKDAKENKYDVSINSFISKVKNLKSASINEEYMCVLGDKKEVYISPMRYDAVIKMMTVIDPDKELTPEDINKEMVEQLAGLIVKVVIPEQTNGNSERVETHEQEYIKDWVNVLPLTQIRQLNETIDHITEWGADTAFEKKCSDCNKKITIITPLNPMSFFT